MPKKKKIYYMAALTGLMLTLAIALPAYAKECTVWVVSDVTVTDETGSETGMMKPGTGYKADVTDEYIYVNSGNVEGYADPSSILVDLSDYMQEETLFYIHYAVSAFATVNGKRVDGYAGEKFYPYAKKDDDSFYVPLLYPVAKRLREAEDTALTLGYTLKIYDAYRPYSVTKKTHELAEAFLNNDLSLISYLKTPVDGTSYGLDWFLARTESRHNYGVAVDLALCDAETGKNIKRQSQILEIGPRSVPDTTDLNSMLLRKIMTDAGFGTLKSEWWHFDMNEYKKTRCDFQAGENNTF